jgi:hypothetical protein
LSRRDLWEPEGEIPSGYPTRTAMWVLKLDVIVSNLMSSRCHI